MPEYFMDEDADGDHKIPRLLEDTSARYNPGNTDISYGLNSEECELFGSGLSRDQMDDELDQAWTAFINMPPALEIDQDRKRNWNTYSESVDAATQDEAPVKMEEYTDLFDGQPDFRVDGYGSQPNWPWQSDYISQETVYRGQENTILPSQVEYLTTNPSAAPFDPGSCIPKVDKEEDYKNYGLMSNGTCSDSHQNSYLDTILHVEADVCFGMVRINDVKLRMPQASDKESIRLSLKIQKDLVTIHSRDGAQYVGVLERTIASVIAQLHHQFTVTLSAFTSLSTLKKSNIYIVIYGQQADGTAIGSLLSGNEIYLQHPDSQFFDPLKAYVNPHYLSRPGQNAPLPETTDLDTLVTSTQQPLRATSEIERVRVLELFNDAQGPEVFRDPGTSRRLRVKLRAHQLKALSMMTEKECGRIEDAQFPTMWKVTSLPDGEKRYYNVVTGSFERPQQLHNRCLGGILADDMGLGKTLTALALVDVQLDQIALGSSSSPDSSGALQTTLVICPKSTINVWETQIRTHFKRESFRTLKYHGRSRLTNGSSLSSHHIVLTTYGTLSSEWKVNSESPLHSQKWLRVILDEAHVIRDRNSIRYQAVCSLQAPLRWCLTGTPIQNKIDDYGALLSFLRVFPFTSRRAFDSFITYRITSPAHAVKEEGFQRLKTLIQSTSLRRTKASEMIDVEFPPRVSTVQLVELSEAEREVYTFFRNRTSGIIHQSDPEAGAGFRSNVFQAITTLRRICNHSKELLSTDSLAALDHGHFSLSPTARQDREICAICGSCLDGMMLLDASNLNLPCGHLTCNNCMSTEDLDGPDSRVCTVCSAERPAVPSTSIAQPEEAGVDKQYNPSSKIIALIENIHGKKLGQSGLPVKSVVFSCWTRMLDLIERSLNVEGFVYQRIDGSKSIEQREDALDHFRDDANCTILLASIDCCAHGLDLTAASIVHIMEPHWNPMVEEQAIDRVHRMGQTQEVLAIRYIVDKSIEQYVQQIQNSKIQLIKRVVGALPPQSELARQRFESLKAALR